MERTRYALSVRDATREDGSGGCFGRFGCKTVFVVETGVPLRSLRRDEWRRISRVKGIEWKPVARFQFGWYHGTSVPCFEAEVFLFSG